MLFPELSHEIVGLSMKVQNQYGYGHNERVYQKALEEMLKIKNIIFTPQPKLPVCSIESEKMLGWYQPDLIIDNLIVVELKATQFPIIRFEDQLKQYLRTSKHEVGYLINFGIKPLYFKRFIHTADRKIRLNPSQDPS